MIQRTPRSNVQVVWRIVVGSLAAAILLAPAFVMALVRARLNLVVALAAILAVTAFSRMPKVRWWLAPLAALLIAVPPYPYWVFASAERGWYLHSFIGFNVHMPLIGALCVHFVVALALFAALFWALPHPQRGAGA